MGWVLPEEESEALCKWSCSLLSSKVFANFLMWFWSCWKGMQWLCNLQYEILFIILTFWEGFGMVFFVGFFFFLVWLILWKNGDSEEETAKWKMMFSEIFVVLETRVSSPPHISCFGAALFSCIDLFWKYFGHIKQARKNQLNKSESSLSMGNMLLGVSYFSVIVFAELCASLCKLHNSGNRYCGEGDGPVTSF